MQNVQAKPMWSSWSCSRTEDQLNSPTVSYCSKKNCIFPNIRWVFGAGRSDLAISSQSSPGLSVRFSFGVKIFLGLFQLEMVLHAQNPHCVRHRPDWQPLAKQADWILRKSWKFWRRCLNGSRIDANVGLKVLHALHRELTKPISIDSMARVWPAEQKKHGKWSIWAKRLDSGESSLPMRVWIRNRGLPAGH